MYLARKNKRDRMDVFLSLISDAKKIHFSFSAQMKPEEYLLFFLVRVKSRDIS